jgi:hypothetical protein
LDRLIVESIKMKPSLVLLAIGLLSLSATACGGSSKARSSASQVSSNAPTTTASGTAPNGLHVKDSNDSDNDPYSNDDNVVLYFGHAASAADRRAVTVLVKRYYAAAAADDGARACPLIYGIIAETIPEEFARAPQLRGKTCAAVMSKVFKQRHQQVAADIPILKVTGVRVEGKRGIALMYLGTIPELSVFVHREGGAWKMESLFESGLP